ncbi:zinc finger BED domain-containing protein RICESLEEPER 2-like [Corylus avellana]|uniref:zinc finger BED domain-containing protein RICESLEEPER 2-like n=1 Tax=Corylus avellana TaxID=13451 RepID=UPI00286C545D|nr:zinc finger BED domain-containing protein RICESLEEPER 2-like [Corylus avellana]
MAESSMVHPSTPPPPNPLMNNIDQSLPQSNPPLMVAPSTNPAGSVHHPTTAEPTYYILTNPPIPFPYINGPSASASGPSLTCDLTLAQPPNPPPNHDPADNVVQQQIQQRIFIMADQPPPMNPMIGAPPPLPPREYSNHDPQETQQTPSKSQTTCQDLIFFLRTNEEIVQDAFESFEIDEDVVEVNSLGDDSVSMGNKKKGKKRRKTSDVWQYYDIVPNTDPNDPEVWAKCKTCANMYRARSSYGTGNLIKHSKTCGGRSSRDVGQMLLAGKAGSLGVSDSKFDPKKFRELLVAAVVKHDLPFSFVEYDGIRAVHQYLRPDVPFISRNTGKADLVKMYLREKQRVKSMLNDCPGRICLTSDLWTSLATNGYICLTAHFINKDWVLTKRVLNFSFMPPPHNGISLSDVIYNLLQEWGIENKIFSITLDNASSNDSCVGFLKEKLNMKKALPCDGDFFHMRCCAHILNLIVQDGLKEINDAIQKVRDSVKYVRGSQVRKQSFLQAVNQMSLDSHKGLKQDVPTRWNSTYLMLESAVHYRRAFSYLEMTDRNYKHCPTVVEWEKVDNIKSFLACFYQATCAFSGTKYPTANLYFPVIAMIYVSLKEDVVSEDEHKSLMAIQMLSKFEKYWLDFSEVLAVAVILDPRYKLHLVNYYYTKIYGVMNSLQYVNVSNKVKSLFMEYSASSIPSSSSSITVQQPQVTRATLPWEQEYLAFGGVDVNSQKSQLEIYLEEPRSVAVNDSFDILSFWKGNEFRYPEVAAMARDVLSIPVSTVASESTFSIGGRVIDQNRSSLKPDIVEALICSRDWLYGEQAQMKLDSIEEEILTTDVSSCDIPNSSGAQSANLS